MSLQITRSPVSGSATAVLPPRVVVENSRELRRELLQSVADNDVSLLVLDLSQVEFMDSSGIGVLVSLLKNMRTAGGDVVLLEPQGSVRMLLDLTRLSAVFTISSNTAQTV